jgi:hypothetical protein
VYGVTVVDPGGNWLRISRRGDEEADGSASTGLGRATEQAARLGDAKGDADLAIASWTGDCTGTRTPARSNGSLRCCTGRSSRSGWPDPRDQSSGCMNDHRPPSRSRALYSR